MKKMTGMLLSTCLLLSSSFLATSCGNNELAQKVDENHAQVEAAIQEAISKAASDLASSEEALKKLLAEGDDVNADALAAAITDFDAAMSAATETINTSMEQADAEFDLLQQALESAQAGFTASVEAITSELNTKADELNSLILANDTEIESLIQAKNELQESLRETKQTVDALSSSTLTEFTELDNAIDALEKDFNNALAALDTVYVRLDNWDSATQDVISATFEITVFYNTLDPDMYYPEEWDALTAIHESTKISLLRATDKSAVDMLLSDPTSGYYALTDAILTKSEIVSQTLTEHGSTPEEVLLNEEWKLAIEKAEQLIAAEQDPEVLKSLEETVALTEALRERYDYLEEQKTVADEINTNTDDLIADIRENGYTADTRSDYENIISNVNEWDGNVGELNSALIDRESQTALAAEYAAAKEAYESAALALNDRLAVFNAPEYVYIYNADLDTVTALYNDGMAWREDAEQRGFALDGEFESPINDALTAFATDVYDRALKLEAANEEATLIEDRISSFYLEIESAATIDSSFKDRFELIALAVSDWKDTYFAAYENEAVIGNANYDLLDHAAFDNLSILYGEKVAPAMGELNESPAPALS